MNWCHLRNSQRSVRDDYFLTVDTLQSVYHLSDNQAAAAVVVVGQKMFGLDWQLHGDGEEITLNTAPHRKRNIAMSRALEAQTLSRLVERIMENGSASVTLHDDGSRTQGTGGYSVAGVTVGGEYYPLPTLSINSETRTNLAELKLTLLSLLAACSGVPRKDIWGKIDFTMTDSVSHNFHVEEIVSEALQMEHQPDHLLCQTHPSLMFSRKMTDLFTTLDTTLGPDKVFAGFQVSMAEIHSSVLENWLEVSLRLVSPDFDHKQWNYAGAFSLFIAPQKNLAKRLQKERFNAFPYSCALALHYDTNISAFLSKYTNITNTLACIVRSFQDLEYLRVLAAVGAIIGIHLVEPFLSLTTSTKVDYSKLQTAFPLLYQNLMETKPELLLDLTQPAFCFTSKERFKSVIYPKEIMLSMESAIETYRGPIISVLKLLLPQLAAGWERQRGEMFGFGAAGELEDGGTLGSMDQEKLKSAPTNNLDPERSVGSINHELTVRGAKQLKAASRAHVKRKGLSLLEGQTIDKKFLKLTKKGGELPNIIECWEATQAELRKAGLEAKDVTNLAADKQRNSDLHKLTETGGPFTKSDQVRNYVEKSKEDDKKKNLRLYMEVRHAKNSSLSYPKSSELFRLKKNFKNLPTDVYAMNLCSFLDKISFKAEMTMIDFQQALESLEKECGENSLKKKS